MARRAVIGIVYLACVLASTHAVLAASSPTQRQKLEQAYGHALRCLNANAARKNTAGAKLSFDAAMKLGRLLGYDNRRLNADFELGPEMAKMARNDAYLQQALQDCAQLGLTSATLPAGK